MRRIGSIAAAAALVAIAAGLPPVVGALTESQVRERIAALDANPMLTASLLAYERGWFSSTAKLELGLAPEQAAAVAANDRVRSAEPVRVTVAVALAHGPIALGEGVHFGWSRFVARLDPDDERNRTLAEELGVPHLFEFRGRTSYAGTVAFDADMPPIDVSEPDREIAFSGASLEGSLAGRNLAWALEAESLRVAEPSGRLVAHGITSRGDLEIRSHALAVGSAALGVMGLQATAPFGAPLLELTALTVEASTAIDASGELLAGTVTYVIGELKAGETQLADATLGIQMANVDVAAIEAYQEALRRSVTANPTDPAAELQTQLEPAVKHALTRSPSLSLEPIRLRWRGEPFEGSLSLDVNGAALPPAARFDLTDPFTLLDAVGARAEATLSKALAQDLATEIIRAQLAMMGGGMNPAQAEYMAEAQAGLMLVTLSSQGYLTDDGSSYSTELRFADGLLTINGNPLPLPIP